MVEKGRAPVLLIAPAGDAQAVGQGVQLVDVVAQQV
jgi:hypothetical protein